MKQLIGLVNIALLSFSMVTFAGTGENDVAAGTANKVTESSAEAIKSDFELLQGVWKDTNSRSRNIRITIDNGQIAIHSWDTQDSEITEVSNILWQNNTLQMVMYTPSTGYRNTMVLRLTGQNELKGTSSGNWNGDILWTRLSSDSK